MSIEAIKDFLMYCTLVNLGMFFLYTALINFGKRFIHKFHGKWTGVSEESFTNTHYGIMQLFKVLILFFNAVPYLVLEIFF